ncbi:hypothetical protein C8R43DRAFT_1001833 [Mycena crocata]|nr:hypothetical protein C8R43DRAFT_1001833 [Mycena crocata]
MLNSRLLTYRILARNWRQIQSDERGGRDLDIMSAKHIILVSSDVRVGERIASRASLDFLTFSDSRRWRSASMRRGLNFPHFLYALLCVLHDPSYFLEPWNMSIFQYYDYGPGRMYLNKRLALSMSSTWLFMHSNFNLARSLISSVSLIVFSSRCNVLTGHRL